MMKLKMIVMQLLMMAAGDDGDAAEDDVDATEDDGDAAGDDGDVTGENFDSLNTVGSMKKDKLAEKPINFQKLVNFRACQKLVRKKPA